MVTLIRLIFDLIADLFRSRTALEAEILVLRQQIIVLRRGKPARLPFMAMDKLVLGWVCRLFPNARDALASSDQRPWCAGIARASDVTGGGSRAGSQDGRSCQRKSVS